MSPLDKKLLRDLRRMIGQAATIVVVLAVGIACFVSMRGSHASLEQARSEYYAKYRFADAFAHLLRAPVSMESDLERVPGVVRLNTRVVEPALLPLEDMSQPAVAELVSIGEARGLNALHLLDGRVPEPEQQDEIVLLHAFAEAHGLRPGEKLPAVINGRMRELRIVGIAMSPEHVFAMAGNDISPDPKRFAVVWMNRSALSAAFDMQGAFNNVAFELESDVDEALVLQQIDNILRPHGGLGAYGRSRQRSNQFIEGELVQLNAMSIILPLIFLGVAALLLNIVMSRLIHLERAQIATLKAIGYTNLEIGSHYLKLVTILSIIGSALGIGLGGLLGAQMVELYVEVFKFPNLRWDLAATNAMTAALLSLAAGLVGALAAVRRVVVMAPAEAMRPEAPLHYRRSILRRLGVRLALPPSVHMVTRELAQRPTRTLLSSLAISASVGLMVVGGWYLDGIEALMMHQFHNVMREDLSVTFAEPQPQRAIHELQSIPGVVHAEGLRVAPVRFHAGHRHRDGAINGYPEDLQMRVLQSPDGRRSALPEQGIIVTDMLAELLHVEVGDEIEVELYEGRRDRRTISIAGVIDEPFGLQGHMDIRAMREWLGEEPTVSMALLRVDSQMAASVDARIRSLPQVSNVTRRTDILTRFREQSGRMISIVALIITGFAVTITIGVVYNNARVSLSMRSRDLASLRVLGFRRSEISTILLGEMGGQVLLGLPFGLWLGRLFVLGMAALNDTETWRIPVVLTLRGYAFAVVVALAASAASALLVRRKLDKLDLISVLKTRQ